MTNKDFEKKIQTEIDPKFTILPNPNRPGLNNIFYEGRNYDLPVVADDVREEIDPSYRYEFPNGMSARMWTIGEIEGRLKVFIESLKNPETRELYEE